MLTKPVRLQHIEAALEAVGLVLIARAGAGSGSSLASPTTPATPATLTLTLGAAVSAASRGIAPASPGFSFSAKALP